MALTCPMRELTLTCTAKEKKTPTYAAMPDALYVYDDMVMIAPVFPKSVVERIVNFEPRQGDVIVAGYPKSGNFWTMEMVHHICNCAGGVETPTTDITSRVKMMEFHNPAEKLSNLDMLIQQQSPRLMSTHMPGRFFEDNLSKGLTKVINIIRDPRDVVVSFYHFIQTIVPISYKGNLAEFYQLFKQNDLPYGDYFRHVSEWKMLALKYPKQVMVFTYSQMRNDPTNAIQQMADFLGYQVTRENIDKIVQMTDFKNMKNNKHSNLSQLDCLDKSKGNFCRKGITGDWVNHFSSDMRRDFDRLLKKKSINYNIDWNY